MYVKNQSANWVLFLMFALIGTQVSAQTGDAEDFDACEAPVGAAPQIYSDDGRHWRMFSTGEASCYTCTRTSITTAKEIAEMKATSGLLKSLGIFEKTQQKFLQSLAGEEDSGPGGEKASAQIKGGYQFKNQREWEGMLKGVVTIAECTDPEEKVVRVTVGISSKTMALADEIADRSNAPASAREGTANGGRNGEAPTSTDRPTNKKSRANKRDF